jgi:hypothetical protein
MLHTKNGGKSRVQHRILCCSTGLVNGSVWQDARPIPQCFVDNHGTHSSINQGCIHLVKDDETSMKTAQDHVAVLKHQITPE